MILICDPIFYVVSVDVLTRPRYLTRQLVWLHLLDQLSSFHVSASLNVLPYVICVEKCTTILFLT